MNIEQIQMRVDRIEKAMLAHAMRQPTVTAQIKSSARPSIYMGWSIKSAQDGWEIISGETIEAALDAVDAYIEALPSPEEAKFRAFMAAVGTAVDIGRENGIEVAFINPLTETMKKLSENALTFQRSAAE